MDKKKLSKGKPSATPWDRLDEGELTPTQSLVARSHRSIYRFRHEPFTGDIDFLNSFDRESCPLCGWADVIRNGHDKNGLRRYRCMGCKGSFSPATGTIFENRKLPISAWVDFLLQALSFESIAVIAREDRRSDTTIPYWFGKVFAVLEGIQDKIVLSGDVQIDETYYPVPGTESVSIDGKRLRGLSRNKICIGVGCDRKERSYFAREGLGKTSGEKTMATFGAHIERGSRLVHDMEKGHHRLIRELDLKDEAHNSKLLSKLDDKDNPLREVNRLCYLLKRFLNSHSGFNRDDLDGWLNLFSIAMNPPKDKMEKVVFVLNRAMGNPKTVRFRDFYNVKPSSEG